MKTKTTATKKKAAANKKKSTNKSQVARAMPVHVPTNATTLQLQQRLAYIQQLEQLDQSNSQLRQMMNAQLASQQQQMGSNNRSSTGVVLPTSTPSQLQHLQQQVVAAQINQVNNRKDMIHQIDKEIRAKIPSVQENKKKVNDEEKVEKVVIKAEQLFHLTVSPGRLGLTIAMNPNGGATITVIDPICTFSSKINVGDRIVTIDGKDVLTLEDIKNGKDRARTFGIMQKVKEDSTTVQKGPKEMVIAAKMAKNLKETSLTAAAAAEVAEMSKDIVALSATKAEKKAQPVTQVDKKTADDASTTVTGKKKTKKQKDPNKPKGFKSAYNFCMADARPIVKAANPDSFREFPKKLGEYWQALSKEERMPYEKMAAADKERYDREMAVYNAKKNGSGEAVEASKVDTSEPQEGKKKRKREVDTSDDKAVGTTDSEEVVEENPNKRLKHEGFFTQVFNKIKGIFS